MRADRRIFLVALVGLMVPAVGRAQGYIGNLDSADCSSLSGWVWDGITDNAVSVDIFDGTNFLITVPANQFARICRGPGLGTVGTSGA